MAGEKLGEFVASGEFLRRANKAITEAVRDLEAKGVKPAYVIRDKTTARPDAPTTAPSDQRPRER